jgi:hypothetical protein
MQLVGAAARMVVIGIAELRDGQLLVIQLCCKGDEDLNLEITGMISGLVSNDVGMHRA